MYVYIEDFTYNILFYFITDHNLVVYMNLIQQILHLLSQYINCSLCFSLSASLSSLSLLPLSPFLNLSFLVV